MREAEAKTKWCPLARVIGPTDEGPAINRPGIIDDGYIVRNTRCLASGCMMWRATINLDETEEDGSCGLTSPHRIV